jgi:hypothetical protein
MLRALHGKLKKPLADVPSHKFVFLAYQLSARLTKSPKRHEHRSS